MLVRGTQPLLRVALLPLGVLGPGLARFEVARSPPGLPRKVTSRVGASPRECIVRMTRSPLLLRPRPLSLWTPVRYLVVPLWVPLSLPLSPLTPPT